MDETRVLSPPVKTRLVVGGNLHPDLDGGAYYVVPGTTIRGFMEQQGIDEFQAPTMCAMGAEHDNWILREEWDSRVIEENTILIDARIVAPYGGGGGGGSQAGMIVGMLFLAILAPYLGAIAGGAAAAGTAGAATAAGAAFGGTTAATAVAFIPGASMGAFGAVKALVTGLVLVGGSYGLQKIFENKIRRPEEPSPTYSLQTQGNVARRRSPLPSLTGSLRIVPDLLEEPFIAFEGQDRIDTASGGQRGRTGRSVQYVFQTCYLSQGYVDKGSLVPFIGGRTLKGLTEADIEIRHPGEDLTLIPAAFDTVSTGNLPLQGPNEYQLISTVDELLTDIEDNDVGQIFPRAQKSELVVHSAVNDTVIAGEDGPAGENSTTIYFSGIQAHTAVSPSNYVSYGDSPDYTVTWPATNGTDAATLRDKFANGGFTGLTFFLGDMYDYDASTANLIKNNGPIPGSGAQDPHWNNRDDQGRQDGDRTDYKTQWGILSRSPSETVHQNGASGRLAKYFRVPGNIELRSDSSIYEWLDSNHNSPIGVNKLSKHNHWTSPYVENLGMRLSHPQRLRHIVNSGVDATSGRPWIKVTPRFDQGVQLRWEESNSPAGDDQAGPGFSLGHIKKDWTAPLRMDRSTGKAQTVNIDIVGGTLVGRSDGGSVYRWGVGVSVQVRQIDPSTGNPLSHWYEAETIFHEWKHQNNPQPANLTVALGRQRSGTILGSARGVVASHWSTHPSWGPASEVNPLGITINADVLNVPKSPVMGSAGKLESVVKNNEYWANQPTGAVWTGPQYLEVRVRRTSPTGKDPYEQDGVYDEDTNVADDRIQWAGLRFGLTEVDGPARSYNHGTVAEVKIRASANLNSQNSRELAFICHRLLPTYGQAVYVDVGGTRTPVALAVDPLKTLVGSKRVVLAFTDHNMAVGQKFTLAGLSNLKDATGAAGTISPNGTYTITELPSKDSIAFEIATAAVYTEDDDIQAANPTLDVGPDAGGSSGTIISVSHDGVSGYAHNPGYKIKPDRNNASAVHRTIPADPVTGDTVAVGDTITPALIGQFSLDYYDVDPQYFTKTESGVWHALDMLRDPFYGAGIPDSQIDLDTWAHYASIHGGKTLTPSGGGTAVAKLPDTHAFYFDQRGTWLDSVAQTLRVHRLKLLNSFGKWTVVRDEPQTLPVAAFSSRNIARESLQVSYSLNRTDLPKWVQVEFFNKNTWNMDTVDGYLEDQNPNETNIDTVRLPGIQTYDHAWREARYLTADARYRRTQVKFSTEYEGLIPLPTQVVTVNHPIPGWGQAGDVIAYDDNGGSGPYTITTDQILDWRGTPIDHNGAFDSATDIAAWIAVGPSTTIVAETSDAHLGEGCVKLTKSSTNTTFGIEQVSIPITAGPLTAAEGAGLYFVAYAKAGNAQTVGKKVRYKLDPDGTGNNAVTGGYATLSEDYWTPLEITYDIAGGDVTQIDSLVVEMDPTDVANGDVFLLDSSLGWTLGGEHTFSFKGDEGQPAPDPGFASTIRIPGDDTKIRSNTDLESATGLNGVINTDADGRDRTQFMFGRTLSFNKKCVVSGIDPRNAELIDVDTIVDDARVHTVDGTGSLPPTTTEVLESTPDVPVLEFVTASLRGPVNGRVIDVSWAPVNGAFAYDVDYCTSDYLLYKTSATGGGSFDDGDQLVCIPKVRTIGSVWGETVSFLARNFALGGTNPNEWCSLVFPSSAVVPINTGDWLYISDLPDAGGLTANQFTGYFQVTVTTSLGLIFVSWRAATSFTTTHTNIPAWGASYAVDTGFRGTVFTDQTKSPPSQIDKEFRFYHNEDAASLDTNRRIGPVPKSQDAFLNIEDGTVESFPFSSIFAGSGDYSFLIVVEDPISTLQWISIGDEVTGTTLSAPIVFDLPSDVDDIVRVRARALGRTFGPYKEIIVRSSESLLEGDKPTVTSPPVGGTYNTYDSTLEFEPLRGDKLYGHRLGVEVNKTNSSVYNFSTIGLSQAICREVAITSSNYNTFIQFTDLPVGAIITSVDVYTNVKNANVVATSDYRLLVGFVGDEDAYAVVVDPLFTQGAMATINMNSIAGLNGSIPLQGKGDSMGVFDSTARMCGVQLVGTGAAPSGAGQIMTITIHYHNAGQTI